MNDKFDQLAKGQIKSAARTLLWLAVVTLFAWPGRANDFKRGPLVQVSSLSPFRDCTLVSADGAGLYYPDDSTAEPFVVVNPANPKNIVATWIVGGNKGLAAGVSFDGGKKWQTVPLPGLTLCSGGSFLRAVDPWLTFAPSGDLYHLGLPLTCCVLETLTVAVAVNKSTDGGLNWSSPIALELNRWSEDRAGLDKDSITADPADAGYVYAVWEQVTKRNLDQRVLKFARTTNGGATWEPARQILDLGNSNQAQDPQILVMPDGTLVCVLLEVLFSNSNGSAQKEAILAVMRSTDKGQTWSAPIEGPRVPIFQAIDPDTGAPYINQNSYPPAFGPVAVDPSNGNLYVAFEDTHFSGGQYADIAFTMSADRGSSWSVPIPINKAPTNIAAANRQAFLPAVAVAADGTIGVTYYDFRFNDANPGLLTDYWLVHCHPSATTPPRNSASWESELRLTDTSFDLEKAVRTLDGYWLGDYTGLATSGNDFLPVWTQPAGAAPNQVFFRRAGP